MQLDAINTQLAYTIHLHEQLHSESYLGFLQDWSLFAYLIFKIDDRKAHLLYDYYLLIDFTLTMGTFAVPSPTDILILML